MPHERETPANELQLWNEAMELMDKERKTPRESYKEILSNAEKLAEFTNVENEKAIRRFQKNNPDFFDLDFWKELAAGTVHVAFKDPSRARTTLTVDSWETFRDLTRQAWAEQFPPDRSVLLLVLSAFSKTKLLFPPSHFQKAVMFLAVQSWRARFCNVCGRRFVPDKPATRLCSGACAKQARLASRNAWWGKHGRRWREKTEHRKRSEKANARPPRRAR